MRRRIAFAFAAAAVGIVVLASPAGAKGIESASITGPALTQPIDGPSVVNSKLPAMTAVWETRADGPELVTLLDRAPSAQLGPRYTITWRITGPGGPTPLRQDVYPHAEGGPLVHTAPGQPFFDAVTRGGWYEAHVGLRDMLSMLGVPPVGVVTPSEAATSGAVSLTVTGPGIPLAAPLEVSGATLPDGGPGSRPAWAPPCPAAARRR
jgi:hypothetical protein